MSSSAQNHLGSMTSCQTISAEHVRTNRQAQHRRGPYKNRRSEGWGQKDDMVRGWAAVEVRTQRAGTIAVCVHNSKRRRGRGGQRVFQRVGGCLVERKYTAAWYYAAAGWMTRRSAKHVQGTGRTGGAGRLSLGKLTGFFCRCLTARKAARPAGVGKNWGRE